MKKKGFKKRFKKRNKKKNWVKKAKVAPNSVVVRGVMPFPDRYFVKLRFNHNYTYTGGSFTSVSFRGNCPRNPFTGTGEVYPLGFQQLATIYGAYRVLGSKIIVRASNQTALVEGAIHVFPGLVSNPTFTNYPQIQTQPYVTTKIISNERSVTFSRYMSTSKIVGKPKNIVYYDANYGAGIGGDPNEQWYWNVFTAPQDNTTTISMPVTIQVIYYTVFDQRSTLYPTT